MKPHESGNGSSKFSIHVEEMGGWVRVYPDSTACLPDDFPVYLSNTLAEWFRQHTQFRLKCVVPIVRDGSTVELHAWYELHAFAAVRGPVPEN